MNFSSPLIHSDIWKNGSIYSDIWFDLETIIDDGSLNYYLFIMNFLGRPYIAGEVITIANRTFPPFPKVGVFMDISNNPVASLPEPTQLDGAEYYLQVMNFLGKPIGG